jgi:hypothetical protein
MSSPSSKPQNLDIDPLLLQASEKIEENKDNLDKNTQIADDNTVKLDNNSSSSSSETSDVLVKKSNQKEKKIKKNVIEDSDEEYHGTSDSKNSSSECEHQDQKIHPQGSAPPDQTFEDPVKMVESVKKFARDHGYTISLKTTSENRKVFKCTRYFFFTITSPFSPCCSVF